ncbi:hypothetical protein KYTH49_13680 [Helicobacter pylori]
MKWSKKIEAAKKIYELIKNAKHSNDDIVLNHIKIKEAFFSPFQTAAKTRSSVPIAFACG